MEEELLNLGSFQHRYNNLTWEERKALYDLRNDTSIIIKEADKGAVVVIWDKEDCLKEAEEELPCKETYEEVPDDPSYLIDPMHRALEKIGKRGDIDTNTLKYFDVEEPNSADFSSCLRYVKGCIVFQVSPLSLTLGFIQKIFPHFQAFILNLLGQKLSHTSRILTTFLENFKTSLNFQVT